MKTTFILSALLGGILLTLPLPVAASDHGGGNSHGQSSQSKEEFEAKFQLLPTADAPADARGRAEVGSNSEGGSQMATMRVKLKGLPDGDYTVSAVKASDGSSVVVGQITAGSSGDTNNEANDQEDNGDGNDADNEFVLPSGLDAADVVQVIVSDSNGTAMLVGDLSDTAGHCTANLNARVTLTAGTAAPDATGFAQLHSKVRKGHARNKFLMIARNVPANSTFTVQVDGTDVGTVKSNKRGKVMVKKLPSTISSVSTVRLVDSTDSEVVRADF